MKKSWEIDVAVCLIFFVRDDTFQKVFDQVKLARPRVLLLWQDGPRKGRADDLIGIQKCRDIALDIDWDCQVYTKFNEKNYGCDPSTFYADKWAFSLVDKCIILEDDQVPSQSYFRFCKELLDRYEHDERISHICGYNTVDHAAEADYFFAHTGTGAWASWRRVAQQWDEAYTFLERTADMDNLHKHYGKKSKMWISYAQRHKKSGIAHWESIIGMSAHLNSQYVIIPSKNLVQNYGISRNATHSTVDNLAYIPREDRKFYLREAYEMTFPMKHPTAILPDAEYEALRSRENDPSMFRKVMRKLEYLFNLVRYGRMDLIVKMAKRKFR